MRVSALTSTDLFLGLLGRWIWLSWRSNVQVSAPCTTVHTFVWKHRNRAGHRRATRVLKEPPEAPEGPLQAPSFSGSDTDNKVFDTLDTVTIGQIESISSTAAFSPNAVASAEAVL